MIGKIERGDVQPTAASLAKLSAALGLTLSELIARAEGDERRLARAVEQPVWVDPETGYRRRSVSPAAGRPLELVEVELPPGVEVPLVAGTYAFLHQQIWVLAGRRGLPAAGAGGGLRVRQPRFGAVPVPGGVGEAGYLTR